MRHHGPTFRWFAWRPVRTGDRGWRWLVWVYRRREYVSVGPHDSAWFSNTISCPTTVGYDHGDHCA